MAKPKGQLAGHAGGVHRKALVSERLLGRLDRVLGTDGFLTVLAAGEIPGSRRGRLGIVRDSSQNLSIMPAFNDVRAQAADTGPMFAPDHALSAMTNTDLARERTAMAAERTLMACIRTALAMISFGFTLGRLSDALGSPEVNLMFGRTTDIAGVAYYLVSLGTIALILAAVQYRIEVAGLVPRGARARPSVAFVIAVLLSLLGIFAFTDLVTRL